MIIQTTKQLRPRNPHDHYPTPSGLVRKSYDCLPEDFTPTRILDCGAGTGVWGAIARERWPNATIVGVELQPCAPCVKYDEWYGGWSFERYIAYHAANELPPFDLVMGNPPYKYAEEMVLLALAVTREGGYVLYDLRLAFLEGQERGDGLWANRGPVTVDTCSRRPSHTRKFIGNDILTGEEIWIPDGKTDSTAYALFCWCRGFYPKRYSGGWLRWDYANPVPEDRLFKPFKLLTDSQMEGLRVGRASAIELLPLFKDLV